MTLVEALSIRPKGSIASHKVPRGILPRLWHMPGGRLGLIILTLLAIAAVVGPFVLPHEPNWPNYAQALKAPSWEHWFGTDATGRDIFSRLLDATHRSLGGALVVLVATIFIGLVVGAIAAMSGGAIDALLMRFADILMTMPGLLLAFAVVGILGPGFQNLIIAMVIADWAYYARLSRSYILDARSQPYVATARMAGVGPVRILFQHIIPNAAIHLVVIGSLGLGGTISAIAGFSFLGLGTQPPYAEWGSMLSESRFYFPIAPWLLLAPAGIILIAVSASNLVGNALRDIMDPRQS